MTEFGPAVQPMVDIYVESVDRIHELDSSLGNTQATGRQVLNKLMDENKDVVAEAHRALQVITLEDDETRQLIFARVFATEGFKIASNIVNAFVTANSPEVDESQISDEKRTAILTERSAKQKLAKQMFGTLEMLLKTMGQEAQLAELPACPEGIKGAFGKRGEMGRKIVGNFFYTVNGEELPEVKTPAAAAKAAGVKTSELRLAVQNAYAEGTPDAWEVVVGKSTISATRIDDEGDDNDFDDEDESAETDADFD